MQTNLTTLANGLRVITATLPGFDSAAVGAFVDVGSRNEDAEENGIAHFLEHMAFKGTTTRTALDIAVEIETLGSNINAYTSQGVTAYFVTGLAATIEKSVAIIGDVVTNSVFHEADIETEKGVILQEISRSFDNPGHVAYNAFNQTAYPGQSIGRSILGPPEFIKSANRDNFVSFVHRYYTARNMVVVGAGDIDHTAFVQMVERYFASIPSHTEVPTEQRAAYVGGFKRAESTKFEQVTALLGWQSVAETDKRVYAHRMLSTAIGGGMSSPLFQEVREKRGLVYAVNAGHDCGPDFGEFIMQAGTTPDKLDEVVKVACGVFVNAASAITEHDLARARNRELVSYATIKEKPFSLARYLASNMFDHGRIVEPDEEKRAVEAVTMSDLTDAAASIFETAPTVAMVGPIPETDYLSAIKAEIGARYATVEAKAA
jgi:predicted Zn-dependent peptidase